MSFVGPMTQSLVDSAICELSSESNQKRIQERVIDPLVNDINRRYAPYFSSLILMLGAIIVLLIKVLQK